MAAVLVVPVLTPADTSANTRFETAVPTVAAVGRGADILVMDVQQQSATGCYTLIHVDNQGRPVREMPAGCSGNRRAIYAGTSTGEAGEYGPEASVALWNAAGGNLGSLRGGKGLCFTTGGDLDWAVICSPISATRAVVNDVTGKGVLTVYSLTAAPRVLARVPSAAGVVMSHDGATLYVWSSQYVSAWSASTGGSVTTRRDTVTAVNVSTGRTRTVTVAPVGQQYRLICSTWDGRLLAVHERRTGMMLATPLRLVQIDARGRVTGLPVPFGVYSTAAGCTADGRSVVHRTRTDLTSTYDRVSRTYHLVSSSPVVGVDNA